jgi:transcriptional regulator with XRE-family HTH domain
MLRIRLKEVLKEEHCTMVKLCHLSEIGYTTIRSICKDPYYITSTETLDRLAVALGVPTTDLFEDVPREQAEAEMAEIERAKRGPRPGET